MCAFLWLDGLCAQSNTLLLPRQPSSEAFCTLCYHTVHIFKNWDYYVCYLIYVLIMYLFIVVSV